MRMLKSLLQHQLSEKRKDLDARQHTLLPVPVMTALRKRIRKGAEDTNQNWANALELVHTSYENEEVVRPEPSWKDAWKQYEENLAYAVQQLATNRGMDGDWRMSAAMFHEAQKPRQRFNVRIDDDNYVTEGTDVFDVINYLTENGVDGHETNIEKKGGAYHLSFSKYRIKKDTRVVIEPISS